MKLKSLVTSLCVSLFASTAALAAPLTVKIIAFNDFHGQLESPGTFRVNAATATPTYSVGGADYFAGHIARLKSQNPHSVVVSAGDLIGATPLISALFHDEPTIEAMNLAGLDFNAVGNHEFDEGKDELKRMQNGGCHPTDSNSCKGLEVGTPFPFEGADFKFLAANVEESNTGKTIFAPYAIKAFGKTRVAFIGMTLEETPTIVTPSGVAGLVFKDEAATVNALIPKLKARGVESIVVLIHQGGTVPTTQAADTVNSCVGGLSGTPLLPIINALDDEVDLVISGHTHQAYNCMIANKAGRSIPVTSANSIGRILTDINMTIDDKSGEVISILANNIVVRRDDATVAPNQQIATLVNNYKTLATPIANRVVGNITATMTHNGATTAGEVALGDVIADAQLAATAPAGLGESVAAFMNPGGIRSPGLLYPRSGSETADGQVTYGEAFTVQPFGNSLVTLSLTGEQIHIMLEQQFTGCHGGNAPTAWAYPAADTVGQPFNRILQVSAGFNYRWSASGPACDKVDPTSISINGVALDLNATYRITVNNFMAEGGDKLYVLRQGTDRLGGAQDIDALEAWLNNPAADAEPVTAGVQVAPGPQNRITLLP